MSIAITIAVTQVDIDLGERQDCFHCPVARALQRATGDDHAEVWERDYVLHIGVWSRSLVAPAEVQQFVRCLDGQWEGTIAPFSFELPALDDPEWEEQCGECEELHRPSELDGDGLCVACRAEES